MGKRIAHRQWKIWDELAQRKYTVQLHLTSSAELWRCSCTPNNGERATPVLVGRHGQPAMCRHITAVWQHSCGAREEEVSPLLLEAQAARKQSKNGQHPGDTQEI